MKPVWLKHAYDWYTEWLWEEFGFARGWHTHLPEMYIYHTTGGAGFNNAAQVFLDRVRRNPKSPALPKLARPRWRAGKMLAQDICGERRTNPVSWFTDHTAMLEYRWTHLTTFHGVGPKIASFIMRDLSFLRDFSDGSPGIHVSYTARRHQHWFDNLRPEDQALFIPVDRYVHQGARNNSASPTCARHASVSDIQATPELHRRAGAEIARWARSRHYDPRDLDVYWFGRGSKQLSEDGQPV